MGVVRLFESANRCNVMKRTRRARPKIGAPRGKPRPVGHLRLLGALANERDGDAWYGIRLEYKLIWV